MSIEKSIIKRNVKLLCVIIWLVSVIMYGYISSKYDIEIAGIFDNAINILKMIRKLKYQLFNLLIN